MHTPKFLLFAVLLAFSIPSASARIGETFEECQARYGLLQKVESKFRPEYPQMCFKMGDVEIRVRFYKGVSAQENFTIDGRMLTTFQMDEIRRTNNSGPDVVWTHHFFSELNSDVLTVTTREFAKVFEKDAGTGF